MQYLFAPEQFVTERFIVRSYLPGDGAALSEAVNASYDHLKTFMPWATDSQSVQEAEKYLLASDFVLGVFSPDGVPLLGGTGFHLRHGPLEKRSAEIGMWIRGSHADRGLGTEVLDAMLQWGFSEWPWERLVWKCRVGNNASARVAENVGMTREGLFRADYQGEDGTRDDILQYAILREEWIARREQS